MGWVSGQQCVVLSIKTKSLCDSVKVEIISSLCWIPFLGFWSLRTEAGPYTRMMYSLPQAPASREPGNHGAETPLVGSLIREGEGHCPLLCQAHRIHVPMGGAPPPGPRRGVTS